MRGDDSMDYEITVALKGRHLFATHERSVKSREKLESLIKLFSEKFPKSEGYEVSVTLWEKTGKFVSIEEIINA